jgi:nucleotide-binding universal stress UspA family protein
MPRILLATHGGPSADGAARVASRLAARWQASLDVLAVVEPFPPLGTPPLDMGFGLGVVASPEEYAGIGEALRANVTAQLRRCDVQGATPVLRVGPVPPEISAAARTGGADLIVIGLGPHGVMDRALGGETALQLVQIASTPVLAVPVGARTLPRRVVAAIDFTATSVRAARTAVQCLTAGDALDLVHVLPERLPAPSEPQATDGGVRLRELASQLVVPSGVEVVAVELRGDPARSLLAYVETSGADLVALGSHGYGWWKRLALGTVASKVVRLATRAVLVAPIGSISVAG